MKKSLKLHFIFKIIAVAGQFGDPVIFWMGFPCGSVGKESACNAGYLGSIPELGRSPGEGIGYPLQYSGLENSVDCVVHRVTSVVHDSNFHFLFFFFLH